MSNRTPEGTPTEGTTDWPKVAVLGKNWYALKIRVYCAEVRCGTGTEFRLHAPWVVPVSMDVVAAAAPGICHSQVDCVCGLVDRAELACMRIGISHDADRVRGASQKT